MLLQREIIFVMYHYFQHTNLLSNMLRDIIIHVVIPGVILQIAKYSTPLYLSPQIKVGRPLYWQVCDSTSYMC